MGSSFITGFPIPRRRTGAELWESLRVLLQQDAYGEEPENVIQVRKCEPQRRQGVGLSKPSSAISDRGCFLGVKFRGHS